MTSTYVKFNCFSADVCHGLHNLNTSQDVLTVALTGSAPAASNTILTDIHEISYTNLSSRAMTISASSQSSGTFKLVVASLVLTASGAVGPFEWVVIYNSTSGTHPLVCYFDYGSMVTLASGETFTVTPDAANGLFQLV